MTGPTEVVRIPILPLGLVNAHLVVGAAGAVLVDAGLPDTERAVEKVLRFRGMNWSDIRLIVITHAHIDHAGNAARLRELTGAPVCAHEGDAQHYRQRERMTFCATGTFGRLFFRTGLIQRAYTPFEPDLLLKGEEVLDLAPYGIAGRVLPTPGHTCGSLSVVLHDGQALVGDLVSSGVLLGGIVMTGTSKSPPFEDDPHQVADELERLSSDGSTTFYMGHGGPLPKAEVLRHVGRLRTTSRRQGLN
ncbi:MBL fold metallo-hydrolase [Piscinibacter gummiphilus]|uniref:MBL fold metallo-hydrolase n=1 Tax=Piscinibacter gummiphilus TaxID=946333 RepID=A0A1W6LD43_9BURK|nr:MBL fold metallo-hydrolase [Piscinibacter gummiphilus]ARN22191.1 MBL fold metallo-hydrolase [Piscinibacter gummiphilus]ATU66880.1 MBL fold metallo-hydrolase [Piscinibacter gummiphilus]GLS94289.1 MBL fold metallo-hydrolase [Piscinibacter gummiphilus]